MLLDYFCSTGPDGGTGLNSHGVGSNENRAIVQWKAFFMLKLFLNLNLTPAVIILRFRIQLTNQTLFKLIRKGSILLYMLFVTWLLVGPTVKHSTH